MTQVYKLHSRDPNFPVAIVREIEAFLGNKPSIGFHSSS
jgi:hypothetical protein